MFPWLNAQTVQEILLRPIALNLVDEHRPGKLHHLEVVGYSWEGNTGVPVAQDSADSEGIWGVPGVLTHGTPEPIEAHLHQTFVWHLTTKQSDISVIADETSILS